MQDIVLLENYKSRDIFGSFMAIHAGFSSLKKGFGPSTLAGIVMKGKADLMS
jgi:hypothetical protein